MTVIVRPAGRVVVDDVQAFVYRNPPPAPFAPLDRRRTYAAVRRQDRFAGAFLRFRCPKQIPRERRRRRGFLSDVAARRPQEGGRRRVAAAVEHALGPAAVSVPELPSLRRAERVADAAEVAVLVAALGRQRRESDARLVGLVARLNTPSSDTSAVYRKTEERIHAVKPS